MSKLDEADKFAEFSKQLGNRHIAVIQLLVWGMDRKQLPILLDVSAGTISKYLSEALTQTDSHSYFHLVARLLEAGLVTYRTKE